MPKGSCACGDFTYELAENPAFSVTCHCKPCQKFAGANGSTNVIVPNDQFKILSGDTRTWTRDGDSGNTVTNNYCSTCGNLMFVDAGMLQGSKIVKLGTLDDKAVLDGAAPVGEIYTRNRPSCLEALQGAKQAEGPN